MWSDYSLAALWALQSGESSGMFQRHDMYETHRNLQALGIEYAVLASCVRLEHKDREDYEAQAREYYADVFPGQDYYGLLSVKYGRNGTLALDRTEEKSHYYPCPYMVIENEQYQILSSIDIAGIGDWNIDQGGCIGS